MFSCRSSFAPSSVICSPLINKGGCLLLVIRPASHPDSAAPQLPFSGLPSCCPPALLPRATEPGNTPRPQVAAGSGASHPASLGRGHCTPQPAPPAPPASPQRGCPPSEAQFRSLIPHVVLLDIFSSHSPSTSELQAPLGNRRGYTAREGREASEWRQVTKPAVGRVTREGS